MKPLFPEEASIRNPVDMIASAQPASYRQALEILLSDPQVDCAVAVFVPPFGVSQEAVAESIRNTLRQSYVAREIAVFYRTNDMSRLVEQSLAKRQIPYQVIGGGSYYERMEVKDVLSMLRFVCNPADGIAFARVANKPAWGMPRSTHVWAV